MAKGDFKYVIQTELKFSPGSLNRLLEDAKTVDSAIRKHFAKTGRGISLPIGIDKAQAMSQIKTDVRSIVNGYNNGQAPKIKLGVAIDTESVDKLKREISQVKHQLNNLDNDKKTVDVKTSLKVSRQDKQKLQQEVGNIKSTMTVGLKLDQNDVKKVQSQINSMRAELDNARTTGTTREGIRRFGAHRDQSPVTVVAGQVQRSTTGSKAEMYARDRRNIMKEISELKTNLKLTEDAEKIKQRISDLEDSKKHGRKSRQWTDPETGKKTVVKNKDFDSRIAQYKQMLQQAEEMERLSRELAKKQDELRRLDSNAFHGNKNISSKLPAHHGVSRQVNSMYDEAYREQERRLAQEKSQQQKQKEMDRAHQRALDFQAKSARQKYKAIESAQREAKRLNEAYNNARSPQEARALVQGDRQWQQNDRAHAQAQAEEARRRKQRERQAEEERRYRYNIHRYGANRGKQIHDDEMVLRNPDASKRDKDDALGRLKQNASQLARTMGQTLTRSYEVFNRAQDGTITRTRTAQYEFTRFGHAIDRSNRFLDTMRNTLQYTALSAVFYEMAQGIILSVQHMAEFEAQLSRVHMITTDLRSGGTKEEYANVGEGYLGIKGRNSLGVNVRRDVYDIAQDLSTSATQTVMPIYQDVMSRTTLTQDENGQVDPKIAKYITNQIVRYGQISLGPNANSQDIIRMSQDMLSLYQGLQKGNDGNDHVYEMDRFVDFMTTMNNSGVNTGVIMDAMSEVAPDALKKDLDIRDVAGLLGAYNLTDSDSSGSAITTVAKTFFGGLAKAQSSPSIQRGLNMLGIDPKGMTQQQLYDAVMKNYSDPSRTEGDRAAIAMELSSVSGKGTAQQPRLQKMLDSYSSEYYQKFQEHKDDTNVADKAYEELVNTLRNSFATLTQSAGEFVSIMGELGALDAFKTVVKGINDTIGAVNTVLGGVSEFGAMMKDLTGVNLPKALTQILAITAALKGMSFVMKKLQISNGLSSMLSSIIGGGAVAGAGARGPLRRSTLNRSNTFAGQTVNLGRRPTTGGPGAIATGVGTVVGNALGWVFGGGRGARGLNPRALSDRGREIAGNRGGQVTGVITRFGSAMGNILPNLVKFGGILARLSAIGLVVTGVAMIGKAVYDSHKKSQQEIARKQVDNFDKTFGEMNLITEDSDEGRSKEAENRKRYEAFSKELTEYRALYAEHQEKQSKNNGAVGNVYNNFNTVKKDPRLVELEKKFNEAGIDINSSSSYRYNQGNITSDKVSYTVQTGVDKDGNPITAERNFDLANDKQWQTMMEEKAGRTPETPLEKMQNAWEKATFAALAYESELYEIQKMTDKFNKTMQRLGYDMSKLDFNFIGAEGSQSALSGQIGLIENSLGSLDTVLAELDEKKKLFADGREGIQRDMDTFRKDLLGGVLSSQELKDLDTEFEMAFANGNAENVISRYDTSQQSLDVYREALVKQNEEEDRGWEEKDIDAMVDKKMAHDVAVSAYLATKQTAEGFSDAEKQAEENILATSIALLQQETALKKLQIALGVAKSGFDVFNAKIAQIQNVVGKAQTLLSLTDDDDEKITRQVDYMKSLSTQVGAYRGQLSGVSREMQNIKNANPSQDFSINALYNPGEEGLTEQQAVFKDLLEKYNGIHTNINSSTVALKEQADALKEMILNSDKYADTWERVQNRIQMVKEINNTIANVGTDMSLAPHLSQVRGAVTGESSTQLRNSRYESIRNQAMDDYDRLKTALQTYAGDEKKLTEAFEEINKTLGSEIDSAFIQPLKDLIQNDFAEAGNLIHDGADKLDQILTYWANQVTSGILTQNSQQFSGDISSASPIGSFNGGSVNAKSMTDDEAISAYIEQQFGYRKGSREYMQIKKQMQLSMSQSEMVDTARKNVTTAGNNGNVHAYAEQIDKMFAGTKLSGYGNYYVQSGAKYGIDPRLMASISMAETGGDSKALRDKNNVSGEMLRSGGLRTFGSVQESIESMASFLKRLYFDQGLDSIPEIQRRYAPSGADNDPNGLNNNWQKNVSSYYSMLTGISQSQLLGGSAVSSGGGSAPSGGGGGGGSSYTGGSIVDYLKSIGQSTSFSHRASLASQHGISGYKGTASQNTQLLNKLRASGGGGGGGTPAPSGGGQDNNKTQWVAQYYTNKSAGWYFSSELGDGRGHNGVDITIPGAGDRGKPVYSFLGGTVAKAGHDSGQGNYVWIKQADGAMQKYMHMLNSASVAVGQTVKAGDQLGQIGNTGNSYGDHLHYEMRTASGTVMDAANYVRQWASGKNLPASSSSAQTSAKEAMETTPADMIKLMFARFKQGIEAQMSIDNIGALNEAYTRDTDLAYGHGNIRDVLGTSGRMGVFDRITSERENIYTSRYNNVQQMRDLAKTRGEYVSDANSALKAGKTDEYNANKEAVNAIDKLVKSLEDNNKALADRDAYLKGQQQLDPRLNSDKASLYIRGGYDKLRDYNGKSTGGTYSVDYFRTVDETNRMNGEYLTTRRRTAMLGELWNNSGQQTRPYNLQKRMGAQEEINLMFEKMTQINGVLKEFAEGSQDWYVTLEDALAVQQELRQLEQQRLENAKSMFELTGNGLQAYVAQKAYTQSKDRTQAGMNLDEAKDLLSSGKMEKGYGIQTGHYDTAESAQNVASIMWKDYNIQGTVNKGDDGKYRISTDETMTKERSSEIIGRLKDRGLLSVAHQTGGGTQDMDANQQLATMQIIAGLHDQLIGQMNEYRQAVVGAFKAGALSLDEYIKKMSDLRDIQAEQRENAVKMVDGISSGFESALSNALAGGMMGNMDSTQGFMDSIKQTLATTVSAQLSNTLINNTGLQTVMTDLIASITSAATSGSPDDIANMFNNNNFGDQIQNALNPFLPLIEQIVASTDGIFAVLKDQLFNETQGFKIDSYLYDMAKGKSFEAIKNWTQTGETNEAGSPVGGVGSNTPIVTPPGTEPGGVPDTTTPPPNGTPESNGPPPNTTPGGTGAEDTSGDVTTPPKNSDPVNNPAPAPAPKPAPAPAPTTSTYTVKSGDTLSEIGARLGIPWRNIASWNGIGSPYTIYVGQKLKIQGGSSGGSSGGSTSGSNKTISSAVNFRSSPAYGNNVMGTLSKGTKVQYHGLERGWAKITANGRTGYVGPSFVYHTGGIAGMMNFANGQRLKSNEIQAIMQKGEIALQPKQLATLLGHTVPSNPTTTSGGGININVTVNVEGGNYDQKGIEKVVETSVDKAMTEFKRQQRLGNLSWKGTSY